MEQIEAVAAQYPWITTLFWLGVLVVAAFVTSFIVRLLLVTLLGRVIDGLGFIRDSDVAKAGIIPRLVHAVPAIIISSGIMFVPGVHPAIAQVVHNVADAVTILVFATAIAAGFQLAGTLWQHRHGDSGRSVKSYVQIANIAVYSIAVILMAAVIVDRSPLILLSGLGALMAVLLLVFQDTLLSLVASIQLSSTDIVRVGDWIEVPSIGVDGNVMDLSLYSVTVRNWDNTRSTFPVRRLVSDPLKNWRGMTESGGRRIKRAISIDQNTVRFLSAEEVGHLATLFPAAAGKPSVATDKVTNLGLFRAYTAACLAAHSGLRKDMTQMVHHLAPGPDGLPLEIYCFTSTTDWAAYEAIQASLFEHLLAMLETFGLKPFQSS